MKYTSKSIRSFIGAKNFDESRRFYKDLGFDEVPLFDNMVLFRTGDNTGFYLQKYYVKKWVDNTMLFLEVDDLDVCHKDILERGLVEKYKHVNVRLSDIKTEDWGREFFVHDPSGILWHFGEFVS